jgi:hypothetical protein
MPKYYFHLIDGEHFEEDSEGAEFPDPAAAYEEARKFVAEIRSDLDDPERAVVEITDGSGALVAVVPVSATGRTRA